MDERDARANLLGMCAENDDYWSCASLAGQPDDALKERLRAEHKQLLGLAKAAAGSGGKNDGGDRHRHQCTGKHGP